MEISRLRNVPVRPRVDVKGQKSNVLMRPAYFCAQLDLKMTIARARELSSPIMDCHSSGVLFGQPDG